MSNENYELRQRVSQLESDVRTLRVALAEAQAMVSVEELAMVRPGGLVAVLEQPKKRGRPAKAKE